MTAQRTWVVKARISGPQGIAEIPLSGPSHYTDDDIARLHDVLRDALPSEAPRRLINATLEAAEIVAWFETHSEPSGAECHELARLTAHALPIFRTPTRFDCVEVHRGPETEVGYLA